MPLAFRLPPSATRVLLPATRRTQDERADDFFGGSSREQSQQRGSPVSSRFFCISPHLRVFFFTFLSPFRVNFVFYRQLTGRIRHDEWYVTSNCSNISCVLRGRPRKYSGSTWSQIFFLFLAFLSLWYESCNRVSGLP